MSLHPLAEMLLSCADGVFPPVDGGWHRVAPWRPGLEAVFAFTGHAVFAVTADIDDARLRELGADGFGGAHHPALITAIAGRGAWIDSLDVVLVARGTGAGGPLVERADLADHPRAVHAASLRDVGSVLGYPRQRGDSIAVLARGIAGLTELSFELDPGSRGSGLGRQLVTDALSAVPAGELVATCVAPGNAASLRAVLGAGFAPVGSVQLFARLRPGASA